MALEGSGFQGHREQFRMVALGVPGREPVADIQMPEVGTEGKAHELSMMSRNSVRVDFDPPRSP